jgi:hypothetical protein
MAYHPNLGQVAADGVTPIGAIYAMRAQAEAAAADARAAAQRAKDRMRSSGATCEIDCIRADDTRGACQVAAVGRCNGCRRTFCDSHASSYRSEQVGSGSVVAPPSPAECSDCQDGDFRRRVEQARTRHQAAEAARQAAEAARRAELERREQERRDHEQRVTEWQAANDWTMAGQRVTRLNEKIETLYQRNPPGPLAGGAAAIAGALDIAAFAVLQKASAVDNQTAGALAVVALLILIVPSILAMVVVVRLMRQSLRIRHIRERDALLEARGCGNSSCTECR